MLAVVGVAPTAAITATPFATNLVKNGGFEAGTAGTGNQVVVIPKWQKFSPSGQTKQTVVSYGSPGGFPTRAESKRIGGGDNFFACGPDIAQSGVTQNVRILGRNSLIDQELIVLTVKARIATYDSQADWGYVSIAGRPTATGANVWVWESAPVTATNGKFQLVTITDVLPAGTRYVDIDLIGFRPGGSGPYCDVYFDKVSMVIKKLT